MNNFDFIKGEKYSYLDYFGTITHHDAEFIGRVQKGPQYNHEFYYVMKTKAYDGNGDFYAACQIVINDRHEYVKGPVEIYLRGSRFYGSTIEELLNNIRGPELKVF